jgi:membrane protease YdiL (CAAX protease family)
LSGLFEEIGWTGFAFPRLSARFDALGGALLLGLLWALWHFPVVDSRGAASPQGAWPPFFGAFAAVLIATPVDVLVDERVRRLMAFHRGA